MLHLLSVCDIFVVTKVFQLDPVSLHNKQRAKKVVSNSPELVDFAIGLVNSVLNLPDGQVRHFEEYNLQKKCEINSVHPKMLRAS